MRLFLLLVPKRRFRIGLQSFLADLFPLAARREGIRHLSSYLRRDIGLEECPPPDWERLLR